MPEFCDESKALIRRVIEAAAKLEILEADLRDRFAMTVYYEFEENRALYEDGHRRTKNMVLKSSSVSMPLPAGLNEVPEGEVLRVSLGPDGASKTEQRPQPPPKPPKADP